MPGIPLGGEHCQAGPAAAAAAAPLDQPHCFGGGNHSPTASCGAQEGDVLQAA